MSLRGLLLSLLFGFGAGIESNFVQRWIAQWIRNREHVADGFLGPVDEGELSW